MRIEGKCISNEFLTWMIFLNNYYSVYVRTQKMVNFRSFLLELLSILKREWVLKIQELNCFHTSHALNLLGNCYCWLITLGCVTIHTKQLPNESSNLPKLSNMYVQLGSYEEYLFVNPKSSFHSVKCLLFQIFNLALSQDLLVNILLPWLGMVRGK